jgi:hypothetical protein
MAQAVDPSLDHGAGLPAQLGEAGWLYDMVRSATPDERHAIADLLRTRMGRFGSIVELLASMASTRYRQPTLSDAAKPNSSARRHASRCSKPVGRAVR